MISMFCAGLRCDGEYGLLTSEVLDKVFTALQFKKVTAPRQIIWLVLPTSGDNVFFPHTVQGNSAFHPHKS